MESILKNREPIIDPELRDLLPPITAEEREALTGDILQHGCYSPLICMADMTLVDGHHRYAICKEHNIPYHMSILPFEDKLTAMEWMISTEKSRRNLSNYQLGLIALKLKPALEAKAKAAQGTRTDLLANSSKGSSPGNDTRKELAASVGIGQQTMGKIMRIQESAPALIKEALHNEIISVNKAHEMLKILEGTPIDEQETMAIKLLHQNETSTYRRIDAEAATAKAMNKALHQCANMDASEQAVRLWMDLCCIEDIELAQDLMLAQTAAENLKCISVHIETIMKERNIRPVYKRQPRDE